MDASTLEEARRAAADATYEATEFGLRVETQNGWECTAGGDVWSRTVFLDVGLADTAAMEFRIGFVPGTAEIDGPPVYAEPAWMGKTDPGAVFTYTHSVGPGFRYTCEVKNAEGVVVFAACVPDGPEEDIFEAGFMLDEADTEGLTEYLRTLGIIGHDATIVAAPAM